MSSYTGFLTGLRASTSSLRPACLTPSSVRQFSSTTPVGVGKPVLVELLRDVPHLGREGDRVEVVSGRARLRLVPKRQARLVPFAVKFGLGPKRAERAPKPVRTAEAPPIPKAKPTKPITPTSDALLAKLAELPPVLDYNLQTMDPNSNILLSTFTLSDVQVSLDHLGLTTEEVITKWQDGGSDRIERIGERVMVVQVRGKGLESKDVTVRVHKTYDEARSWETERREERRERREEKGRSWSERSGKSKQFKGEGAEVGEQDGAPRGSS